MSETKTFDEVMTEAFNSADYDKDSVAHALSEALSNFNLGDYGVGFDINDEGTYAKVMMFGTSMRYEVEYTRAAEGVVA